MLHVILAVLLGQLGADDFATRERAHAALARLGPVAHPQLYALERSKDAEVRQRARQLLDRWYAENAERIADELAVKFPWCPDDCGWLEQARAQVGIKGPPHWNDYRMATRLMVVDMIRRRASRAEVATVLDTLAKAEQVWIAEHGQRFITAPADTPE